jgi:hypothetical protein
VESTGAGPGQGPLPQAGTPLLHGELSYTKLRALHDVATQGAEARLLRRARSVTREPLRRLVGPLCRRPLTEGRAPCPTR